MTDAIGLPLTESPTEEVSAMGAAVMAMAATGEYESLSAASKSMAEHGATTEPEPTTHALYLELGEIQAATYHALEDVFDRQYEFARRHPMH